MNLLESLLSIFLGEKSKDLAPLLENLFKNGFDLKSALHGVDLSGLLSTILPLFAPQKDQQSTFTRAEEKSVEFDLKMLAGEEIFTLLTAESQTI